MEPEGFTIFCDDVRGESSGKVSLIGCYGTDLRLLEGVTFPVMLPKLGFHITLRLPVSKKARSFEILVYLPGEAEDKPAYTSKIEIPQEKVDEHYSKPMDEKWEALGGDRPRFDVLRHSFVLSPVFLIAEGYIRVRVMLGEERLRVGALQVIVTPPISPTEPSPPA